MNDARPLREAAARSFLAAKEAIAEPGIETARKMLAAMSLFLKTASIEARAPEDLDVRAAFLQTSRVLGELAAGSLPSYAKDAIGGRGRPHDTPAKIYAKSKAAIFRQACRPEGFTFNGETHRLNETAPTARLAKLYGMSERNMRKWAHPDNIDLLTFGPLSAEVIVSQTERAGATHMVVEAERKRRKRGGGH